MKPVGTIPIETDRLLLRRHLADDADAIFRNWASDPAAARFWSWDVHRTPADTRAVLAQWLAAYDDPAYCHWAIVEKDTAHPIGYIYLDAADAPPGCAAVHFLLGSRWWDRGYATEACRAVCSFAFDRIGLHALLSRHHADNPASGRVLLKCGFSLTHSEFRRLTPDRISGTYLFYRNEKR